MSRLDDFCQRQRDGAHGVVAGGQVVVPEFQRHDRQLRRRQVALKGGVPDGGRRVVDRRRRPRGPVLRRPSPDRDLAVNVRKGLDAPAGLPALCAGDVDFEPRARFERLCRAARGEVVQVRKRIGHQVVGLEDVARGAVCQELAVVEPDRAVLGLDLHIQRRQLASRPPRVRRVVVRRVDAKGPGVDARQARLAPRRQSAGPRRRRLVGGGRGNLVADVRRFVFRLERQPSLGGPRLGGGITRRGGGAAAGLFPQFCVLAAASQLVQLLFGPRARPDKGLGAGELAGQNAVKRLRLDVADVDQTLEPRDVAAAAAVRRRCEARLGLQLYRDPAQVRPRRPGVVRRHHARHRAGAGGRVRPTALAGRVRGNVVHLIVVVVVAIRPLLVAHQHAAPQTLRRHHVALLGHVEHGA
mmetsp:Transcript_15239/g.53081  ORF Transcript_15239/g.53081 Transcript_15239/m.53081 type:complete len:412 (-) Transcript_15239:508-1743(-)